MHGLGVARKESQSAEHPCRTRAGVAQGAPTFWRPASTSWWPGLHPEFLQRIDLEFGDFRLVFGRALNVDEVGGQADEALLVQRA